MHCLPIHFGSLVAGAVHRSLAHMLYCAFPSNPSKTTNQTSRDLRAWWRVKHWPPLLPCHVNFNLVHVLKLELETLGWQASAAAAGNVFSANAELVCYSLYRWAPEPFLWTNCSPQNLLGLNLPILTRRCTSKGNGMQPVFTGGYVLQVLQCIVGSVAILVVHLPRLIVFWRTMKTQLDHTMNIPIEAIAILR